jgi:hypothetical protein
MRAFLIVITLIYVAIPKTVTAQEAEQQAVLEDPNTLLWLNTYGNIRVSNRLFWIAQTHFRFKESANTPFAGQIAQVYNRHALSYLFSKKFNVSLGGVLRVNFNDSPEIGERNTVPEWRIWHQYQFANPLGNMMTYHRFRIEHRWTRGYNESSEYQFRNRWRYMLRFKIPLSKRGLAPNSFYIAPETELIMQSGAPVVDSPMEDLRITTTLGYIINPRLTVASGFMYSLGQELSDGAIYSQNYTIRIHLYFAPDLRRIKNKLPEIHKND